jgi:hypothetical protein
MFNNNKTCNDIRDLNSKFTLMNIEHKEQRLIDLKKELRIFTQIQNILKISNALYVSIFKYQYNKTYLSLNFLFTLKNDGSIIYDSYLDKLPVTSNILNLKILDSDRLNSILIDELKLIDTDMYKLHKYKKIEKLYFKTIKRTDRHLGYLSLSYKDEYEIDEQQKEEIERIVTKISEII